METKLCRDCGQEKPLTEFKRTRGGFYTAVCRQCVAERCRDTRYTNREMKTGGREQAPFSDPDFDGRQPVEVIQLMSRAKKWLEARGYSITLKGEYRKLEIKKIRF